MYNRYKGNTGKVVRVEEKRRPAQPYAPAPQPYTNQQRPPRKLPLLSGSLTQLIPNAVGELETEDVILLLILYLMYRESGDPELLIMLGAMFLL